MRISDVNIDKEVRVTPAAEMRGEIPIDEAAVLNRRDEVKRILEGVNSRHLLIAGPCSIHDLGETKYILQELRSIADAVKDVFLVVARFCPEKPRTGIGWPGYIWDPHMNGTLDPEKSLRDVRHLMAYAATLGLGLAAEFVDTDNVPRYITDGLCYGWIGARTSESHFHHAHASRTSVPVGIKNSLSGSLENVISGIKKARAPAVSGGRDLPTDSFAMFTSKGNAYAHLILRGTTGGTNYDRESVLHAGRLMNAAGVPPRIVIDCNHGNSGKDPEKQIKVFTDVSQQMGYTSLTRGAMLEVYINAGAQKIPADLTGFDRRTLRSGLSVTDACMSFQTFKEVMKEAYRMIN